MSLSEALACIVEGEGEVWAHRDDVQFNALKSRGLVTYSPGNGGGKQLVHGRWTATEDGKLKYKGLK